MLDQKTVDAGIARLIKQKEEQDVAIMNKVEKAAAKKLADEAKKTADVAKDAAKKPAEAEYQAACHAAIVAE